MTSSGAGTGRGSWAARLAAEIERDRFAGLAIYAGTWAVAFAVVTVTQWAVGAQRVWTFVPLHAVIAAGLPVPVYLVGAFDRSAARAMARVRPVLAVSDEEAAAMTRRLVDTPIGLELGVAAFWVAFTLIRIGTNPDSWASINLSLDGWAALVAVTVLALFVISVSALVVKIGHLAWGISRISQVELSVSLWELGPLNGFSVLTAQIAASLVAWGVAIYASRPQLLADPVGLLAGAFGLAFSAGVFVVPLAGIHGRLVAEKVRLTAEAARQMEAAAAGLHGALAARDLAAMDAWNKAIGALDVELRTLAAFPTWPWLPDTFRWVVGALMFPIVLFLVQFVITKLLAP